jgi:hypothetical protein
MEGPDGSFKRSVFLLPPLLRPTWLAFHLTHRTAAIDEEQITSDANHAKLINGVYIQYLFAIAEIAWYGRWTDPS